MQLDPSVGFDCYAIKKVTHAYFIERIRQTFPDDKAMVLIPPKRQNQTVWTLETDNIDLYKLVSHIKDVNGNDIAAVQVVTPRKRVQTGFNTPSMHNTRPTMTYNDRQRPQTAPMTDNDGDRQRQTVTDSDRQRQ